MKKRILALALAGTTAFSMFGGLNVFAVTEDADAFQGKNYPAYTNPTANLTFAAVSQAPHKDLIVTDAYSDVTVEPGYYYLFDYKADPKSADVSYTAVIEAVESGISADIEVALRDYYGRGTAEAQPIENGSSFLTGVLSSARKAVITEFNSTLAAAKGVDFAFYDSDELDAYNVPELINAVKTADADSSATSYLLYLVQEYDRVMEYVAPTSTWSETYADKLADAEALEESDYTAANWLMVQSYIASAEALAAKGTEAKYKEACSKLDSIYTSIKTIAPDYADLKAALADLYTDGKIPSAVTYYTGTAANNCVYLEGDYTVKGKLPDEWYDFAGTNLPTTDDDYVKGAYRSALEIYNRCKVSSTRAYVGQSVVDSVLADLEDSLSALDPNYSSANWALVRLEEAIEKAEAVDENDYKTTSTKYKAFVKALEAAQKALDTNPIKTATANTKAVALEEATAALKGCAKTIPAATKTELKALLKEAKDMLKDVDGKTSAQIIALTDAYNDGNKVYTDGYLISAFDGAVADLEAAIAGYKQAQGWYKDAAGKWMYGTGETYLANGWNKIGASWYYFNADGTAKQSEWMQENGEWYWFTNNATAAYGWAKVDGNWYYFKGGCKMATGWVKVDGSWYYLAPSGKMVTGWAEVGGKWYYFSKETNALGQMLANTTVDGYKLGADGAWVK